MDSVDIVHGLSGHCPRFNTPVGQCLLSPWIFYRRVMPNLVTSNFDDDSIKNEQASMETPFSHYKSMRNFLDAQGS